MATIEQALEQLQQMSQRQTASETEVLRLREENQRMVQLNQQAMPALLAALERQAEARAAPAQPVRTLVESRGLGRPPAFQGQDG